MSECWKRLIAYTLMLCGIYIAGWLLDATGWRDTLGLAIALITGALYGMYLSMSRSCH